MNQNTDPCLLLDCRPFVGDDEVTRFSDLGAGYVHALQIVFPLFVAQSCKYQLS